MKPKEYLVKHGHIKEAGRGRLSKEHIAIIEAAVRNGAVIEGYSVSTAASTSDDKPAEVKKSVDPNAIQDVPEETRPEREWVARRVSDGKFVGMRTVCNRCKNSLTHCLCHVSMVWADHNTEVAVEFVPRGPKQVLKRFY